MKPQYTIGLDYGTNSVRALIVNVANGAEVAAAVWIYAHGSSRIASYEPECRHFVTRSLINRLKVKTSNSLIRVRRSFPSPAA